MSCCWRWHLNYPSRLCNSELIKVVVIQPMIIIFSTLLGDLSPMISSHDLRKYQPPLLPIGCDFQLGNFRSYRLVYAARLFGRSPNLDTHSYRVTPRTNCVMWQSWSHILKAKDAQCQCIASQTPPRDSRLLRMSSATLLCFVFVLSAISLQDILAVENGKLPRYSPMSDHCPDLVTGEIRTRSLHLLVTNTSKVYKKL